ncbi:hypothetical protein [Brevundimonas sp. FT23028]|uniref:hypothetical protein n=1 Tax=Brevundimonas sp. FT23028 TaxID=3393748 RepID=UPI003B58658F
MNTLRASDTAAAALRKRKVHELAALVRGRVECFPGSGLLTKVATAENRIALLRYDEAERMLREVDDSLAAYQERLDEANTRAEDAEQDKLLEKRGIETDRGPDGIGVRHGFMWLERKKRVHGHRRQAGQAWGRDYSIIRTDGLKSCLNDNAPGGGSDPNADQERKTEAKANLDRASAHIHWATGSYELVGLLDAVCGRGETLRDLADGDKLGAAVREAQLMIALDLAAVAYDIRVPR